MSDSNVFGKPVTEGTVAERALEAENNDNVDGKRDKAIAFVDGKKLDYGNGVSTRGIFYNATGMTLLYCDSKSEAGHFEVTVPTMLRNGQWGAFFHTQKTVAPGSSTGFALFKVKGANNKLYKPLFAWSTPVIELGINENQAYCDIFEEKNVDTPDEIFKKMHDADTRVSLENKWGFIVKSGINMGFSPFYEAKLLRGDDEDPQPTST